MKTRGKKARASKACEVCRNDPRVKFTSKEEYEQKLNELIGFEKRFYLNVY